MNIPIFRLEFEKEFVEKYKKGSEEILTSGRPLGENKYVELFEKKFSSLVGAKYAVAVTNGTAAIELALKAVNVKNKKVIIPANTFFATSVAVTNSGAEFELVDVEEESFSIDPAELELLIKKLKKDKEKIGAVIIVHVGGIISQNIAEVVKICKKYKIPLIEDAAQAHLSFFGKYKAGTIGEIAAFSFFPTKVMTTGEGGMITTNNKKYYELIKSLKNFGRDNDNIEICINPDGNNFKISEFTGLFGYLECERVKKRVEIRNKYTNLYVKNLKDTNFIPVLQKKGTASQYKMILRTNIDREWLRKYLKDKNITLTGEVWKTPIHQQPLYKSRFKNKKFPVTDLLSATHICPPLYPELTLGEIKYICDILIQAEKDYEKQSR